MTADLTYLAGRSRIATTRPGFHGLPEGTECHLRVWKEETERRIKSPRGTTLVSRRPEMLIELTAPDGTRHRFHTDPAEVATATAARRQPAGFAPSTPIVHHSIDTFVEFFHAPMPCRFEHTRPADHSLLDLLEAIAKAASTPSPALSS